MRGMDLLRGVQFGARMRATGHPSCRTAPPHRRSARALQAWRRASTPRVSSLVTARGIDQAIPAMAGIGIEGHAAITPNREPPLESSPRGAPGRPGCRSSALAPAVTVDHRTGAVGRNAEGHGLRGHLGSLSRDIWLTPGTTARLTMPRPRATKKTG